MASRPMVTFSSHTPASLLRQFQTNPLASNTNYNPYDTPGFKDAINTITSDVTNNVNGSWLSYSKEHGWLTLAWPKEYGGLGASHIRQSIFAEECAYHGAPSGGSGVHFVGLAGATDRARKFIPFAQPRPLKQNADSTTIFFIACPLAAVRPRCSSARWGRRW